MVTIVVLVVVVATAIWVYFDAKSLGVTRGDGALSANPSGWLLVTLVLWIVGFPLYLAMRPEFKRRAASRP